MLFWITRPHYLGHPVAERYLARDCKSLSILAHIVAVSGGDLVQPLASSLLAACLLDGYFWWSVRWVMAAVS